MPSDAKCTVVIAGGGTGGHLYPGIAIAEELKKQLKDVEIIFMGAERGIEARILPSENYYVKLLKTDGFVGVSFRKKAAALFRFMIAFFKAYAFLRSLKPGIVIGTGGYASFIPVFAAMLLGIPTVVAEQNSVPGQANRILAKFAKKICITYENSLSYFPKNKTILTGNPVREKILRADKAEGMKMFSLKDGRFTIFIFGGSMGASSINKIVVEALEHLTPLRDRLQFLHQTGEKDFEFVKAAYLSHGMSGTVAPFIYKMPEAYASCDMIISRAGATTLAEITAIGIPSLLVPYPHATSSHQEVNASRLAVSGAAMMIKEADLTGKTLAEYIQRLYNDEMLRTKLSRDCMTFGKPDAAKKVANIAIMLLKNKSSFRQEATPVPLPKSGVQ
ncbi:MAG: undecaprenyldiphospho-muramoylpentapeptide beta-N-acetylglucosaminyltransferase [Candidatus Magnetominusculus sp. LBB02]|nr:undecaprenyldiphospho-muramoylpentapeptide beta-N-acetylglucosaminyltransferase [Candidatus Magnetominusculus sp. LBB02]